jgi:hypothetical protein
MPENRIRHIIDFTPHSKKQALIMNAFFIPGLLEMWVAAGSKFGKSISLSGAFALKAPLTQQALYRWIAPIYSQSKIGFKYIKRIMPPEPYVKVNESALSLYMPTQDTMIQFFHGQDPESLEGEATNGNALDEASKMKEEVYSSVKTTTGVTEGPIIGISTPRGKNNWFYRKCMEAKEEMLRAQRENRRPRKIFIHAPSWTNPAVSMDVINDAKRTMPLRLWRQYYEADFVADGSVFTGLDSSWKTDAIDENDQFLWIRPDADQMSVVIGVDWARNVDFTVFSASCMKTRDVVGIWRMRGVGYPSQIAKLKTFSKRFKSVESVWHDKTGVGIALDDLLAGTDLPFRGITFTNASKNELMVKLMLSFEEASFGLPQISALVTEFNDIEVKTTATGLPTYAAPTGATDDIVMSVALSHAAMLEHSDRDYGIIEF